MRFLISALLCLYSTVALAQQVPTQAQRLQQIISSLIGESTELATKLDQQALEIAKLRKELAEKSKTDSPEPKKD